MKNTQILLMDVTFHGCYPQKTSSKLILFLIFIAILAYSFYRTQNNETFSTPLSLRVSQKKIPEKHVHLPPMYPYIIEEDQKCLNSSPFLLLLIPSVPQEGLTRSVLRRTWANETLISGVHIMRLFLLGRPSSQEIQAEVKLESDTFHDIIQQDYIDSYMNLTLKTLMGVEWASRLCPNVSYIMKIDADMFFNPWLLVEKVLQPNSPAKNNFYTGLPFTRVPPMRQKSKKWYMPLSQYSKEFYPPYCKGAGYILSGDLSARIYRQAQDLPIFPFEDVFIGMCMESIGIQIFKPSGNWFMGSKNKSDKCHFVNFITVHRFTSDELLELWPDFTSALDTCRLHKHGLTLKGNATTNNS